eukprot:339352-Chlamydomonas_euryale.AAC.4
MVGIGSSAAAATQIGADASGWLRHLAQMGEVLVGRAGGTAWGKKTVQRRCAARGRVTVQHWGKKTAQHAVSGRSKMAVQPEADAGGGGGRHDSVWQAEGWDVQDVACASNQAPAPLFSSPHSRPSTCPSPLFLA